MRKIISAALVIAAGMALPAQADPTVGFGLSIALGGGSTDVGFGVRVFSDDEEESAVASLGLDYMFQSGSLRPTVGVAYLDEDFYLGLDLGYDFGSGGINFGTSAGWVDTESDDPRPASPPPQNGEPVNGEGGGDIIIGEGIGGEGIPSPLN